MQDEEMDDYYYCNVLRVTVDAESALIHDRDLFCVVVEP